MSRVPADQRLERLLVMVPWVSEQDGPRVEDVCDRFGITEPELAADLELLFMCGLYPFTPDTLIEADIADGRVWIRYADAFQRPPMFTMQEAVGLIAAATAVAELPQNESNVALQGALAKLRGVMGLTDSDVVDVALAPAASHLLELLRHSIEERRTIELDYYSYGRDAWSRRQLEPYRLFNAEGQWYLQAGAPQSDRYATPQSGGVRNFRLDRMRNAITLDQPFDPPLELPPPRAYSARGDEPVVVLDLDEHARWAAQQYPVEAADLLPDGKLRVTLRVSEQAWLDRLLLRLGNHATVVEGDVDVSAAASEILRRYL